MSTTTPTPEGSPPPVIPTVLQKIRQRYGGAALDFRFTSQDQVLMSERRSFHAEQSANAKEWEAAIPHIHHLAYSLQRTTGKVPNDLWLGNREWACLRAWMDMSGMTKISSAPPNHFLFEALTVRRVLEDSCLRVGFSVSSVAE